MSTLLTPCIDGPIINVWVRLGGINTSSPLSGTGSVTLLSGGGGLDLLRRVNFLLSDEKPRFSDCIELILLTLPDRDGLIGLFLSKGTTSSSWPNGSWERKARSFGGTFGEEGKVVVVAGALFGVGNG